MHQIAWILLWIKTLLIIPFGIILSSLVLYAVHVLHMSDIQAMQLVAALIAGSGLTRIVGSYVGDRFVSHLFLLKLAALGILLGCILIINPLTFYFGLTAMVIGSGLTVSINCLLTNFFDKNHRKRQTAFLWNYSGINLGYLISFLLSGYFELTQNYIILFLMGSFCGLLAFIMIRYYESTFQDADVIHLRQEKKFKKTLTFFFILFIYILFYFIIQYKLLTDSMVLTVSVIFSAIILYRALGISQRTARFKIYTYFLLMIPALIFWSLFHLTPMVLTLFIERNIDRHILAITISPQWAALISTTTLILAGPLYSRMLNRLAKKGIVIAPLTQFALSLCLIGFSLWVLALGITNANSAGLINFNWIIISFILQGLAEILIAPIGFAMIAFYATPNLRGIMMGNWMLLISVGIILSNHFSTQILRPLNSVDPYITNAHYLQQFLQLGRFPIILGLVILTLLYLSRLFSKQKFSLRAQYDTSL